MLHNRINLNQTGEIRQKVYPIFDAGNSRSLNRILKHLAPQLNNMEIDPEEKYESAGRNTQLLKN